MAVLATRRWPDRWLRRWLDTAGMEFAAIVRIRGHYFLRTTWYTLEGESRRVHKIVYLKSASAYQPERFFYAEDNSDALDDCDPFFGAAYRV